MLMRKVSFLFYSIVFFTLFASQVEGALILRWGDVLPGSSPSVEAIHKTAQEVLEKSDGKIAIKAFPSGQLGSSREMIEGVMFGSQEIVTEGAANLGQLVPSLSILEAPYLWRNIDHLKTVMAGSIGAAMRKELLAKTGMRLLGFYYYGVRHMTMSKKRIESVKDMEGVKLRVPENKMFLEMARAWRSKPTPMNFSELYLALRQGVVEGQENPLPTINAAKFYEVQKYLILTAHVLTPRLILMNDGVWQGMSKKDQAILANAVQNGIAYNNAEILNREKSLIEKFKAEGMEIITPDRSGFRQAVLASVPKKFEEKWGKGVFQQIVATQ